MAIRPWSWSNAEPYIRHGHISLHSILRLWTNLHKLPAGLPSHKCPQLPVLWIDLVICVEASAPRCYCVCRGSYTFEEPATPKSPPVLPNSPWASQVALPPQAHRQPQTNAQTPAYPCPPVSPKAGGDAAHILHTAAGQISLDALQPTESGISEEEHSRLKDENQALADR